jgi:hypothetical protein
MPGRPTASHHFGRNRNPNNRKEMIMFGKTHEEKTNGELMIGYYNAWKNGDAHKQEETKQELEKRGVEPVHHTSESNPSWHYRGKRDQ